MKIQSLLAGLLLMTGIVFTFQNCGSNSPGNTSDISFNQSEEGKTSLQSIEAKEGVDLQLDIPSTEMQKAFKGAEVTCSWTYTSSQGSQTDLGQVGTELLLTELEPGDSGTYQAICRSGNITKTYIFVLTVIANEVVTEPPVQDPVDTPNRGLFQFTKVFDGKNEVANRIKDVTKQVANLSCEALVARLKKEIPHAGFVCVWKDDILKTKAEQLADYSGFFIDKKDTKKRFSHLKAVIRSVALSDCQTKAKAQPQKDAICFWNKMEIFKQKGVVPPKKALFVGIAIKNKKENEFARKKDFLKEDAQKECKTEADKDLKQGMLCKWDGKVFFVREEVPEPPKTAAYTGHFIVKGKEVLFSQNSSIARHGAMADCKKKSAGHPKKGVICRWDGKIIFQKAEPKPAPEKKNYRAFIVQNGKESILDKKDQVIKPVAIDSCKALAKKHPHSHIICRWGGDVVHIEKGEAKKANYKGFFIVAGKRQKFIETNNIVKNEALKNCKTNAKNNPKKKVLCIWDGKTIFQN